MNFAVPADYIIKIKENEKIGQYLDFARELKIPIVVGTLGIVSEGLEKKPIDPRKNRDHSAHNTMSILQRILELGGDFPQFEFRWKLALRKIFM